MLNLINQDKQFQEQYDVFQINRIESGIQELKEKDSEYRQLLEYKVNLNTKMRQLLPEDIYKQYESIVGQIGSIEIQKLYKVGFLDAVRILTQK